MSTAPTAPEHRRLAGHLPRARRSAGPATCADRAGHGHGQDLAGAFDVARLAKTTGGGRACCSSRTGRSSSSRRRTRFGASCRPRSNQRMSAGAPATSCSLPRRSSWDRSRSCAGRRTWRASPRRPSTRRRRRGPPVKSSATMLSEMLLRILHVPSLMLLLAAGRIPREPAHDQQWPQLTPGVWELETTWTPAKGKARQRKESATACQEPAALLQGYWGTGIVERAGCRFQSTKIADAEFRVISECAVRRVGIARSESTVSLDGAAKFSMKVRHREGRLVTMIEQTGHWVASCPGTSQATQ